MAERFASVEAVQEGLRRVDYQADPATAVVVFLADRLDKPPGARGVPARDITAATQTVYRESAHRGSSGRPG